MRSTKSRILTLFGVAVLAMVAFALVRSVANVPRIWGEERHVLSASKYMQPPVLTAGRALPQTVPAGAETEQAVFDDLVVEDGETIEGGVVVYSGEARVKSGGRIDGDLVVYSGDIRIDEGGRVDGNVSTFSGDVRVAGRIDGNVTTWSGDVNLRDSAVVTGDVSVLNGDVDRASGASVGGNVVRGPRLELPQIPSQPFGFGDPGVAAANSVAGAQQGVVQRLFSFIMRLIGLLFLSLVVGIVAWLIAQVRPSAIHATRATMSEQPALSFVVGILANVVLLLAGAFFAITVCLIPLTLAAYAILIGLNVVGWAALSYVVGQRVTQRYDLSIRWDLAMALTAAIMAAALGLFWAIGGCFRFFGFAGMLVVSSLGAGAVLLPLVNRFMGSTPPQLTETSPVARAPEVRSEKETDGEGPAGELPGVWEAAEAPPEAAEQEPEEAPRAPDDFTQIRGLGPVASERLVSAGVTSYAALAQLSAEEIGEILNWSPDRVRRSDIAGQAAQLSSGTS